MKRIASILALAVIFGAQGVSAQTLKTVKERGTLNCGANGTLAGFGLPDAQGKWTGLDVDVCRAIAAALFNDANKVKFVPLSAKDRFTALQSGEVDVLMRNTTWTSSRDTSLGLNFTGVDYYDGQGFMVRKTLKVNSALELNGASVCVQQGTTTELNLADYFRANKMQIKSVNFATANEAVKAYDAGRCDAYTTDASGLYSERLRLANANDHIVLPEIISKEPLGPAVRHGDDQWFDVVKWTLYAMINAEELNLTQKNIDEMTKKLIEHGRSPDTPVAVVRWGTRADQKTIVSTLKDIAALVKEKDIMPPAVTVIGDVVKLRSELNWYEKKPMFGQRILVTR
ncbi:MAG: transporter substrate-binding domain-containing protein, partial [Betaproteobacteria bacterium]|nr:transporter substrate-binding domain-containing protein [Betaproteobacteria bacterium]